MPPSKQHFRCIFFVSKNKHKCSVVQLILLAVLIASIIIGAIIITTQCGGHAEHQHVILSQQCLDETMALNNNNNHMNNSILHQTALISFGNHIHADMITDDDNMDVVDCQTHGFEEVTCDYSSRSDNIRAVCHDLGGAFYETISSNFDVMCGNNTSSDESQHHPEEQPSIIITKKFHGLNFGVCVGNSCTLSEFKTLALHTLQEHALIMQGFDNCQVSLAETTSSTPITLLQDKSSSRRVQSQCDAETMTLDAETDYSDYNSTSFTCDNVTNTCSKVFPVEVELASCSSLGGSYYVGDVSANCTDNFSVELLSWGICAGSNCSFGEVADFYSQNADAFALRLMNNSHFQGCVGSSDNVHLAANTGSSTTTTTTTPSPSTPPPSSLPTTGSDTSAADDQCVNDTLSLGNQMNFSDYENITPVCNNATHVCTTVLPVENDLLLCSGLGGIYYVGDVWANCTEGSVALLSWGRCTGTSCSLSLIDALYIYAARYFASQLMNASHHPLHGCVGSATNVYPPVADTGPTAAPTPSPLMTTLPPTSTPAVVSADAQCLSETITLENEMDYSNYIPLSNSCDGVVSSVCIEVYPVANYLASCSSLGGIYYIGDIWVNCSERSFERLSWGVCTGTNCSLSVIDDVFSQYAQGSAINLMNGSHPLHGCVGSSATNIRAAASSGESTTNAPTPPPFSTLHPTYVMPVGLADAQCENDTFTLEDEIDYSDYNVTSFTCDHIANVCTEVYPVANYLASCSSLGGVYYVGDIWVNCTDLTIETVSWGLCTGTTCSFSMIADIYNQDARDFASQRMNGSHPLQGCVGSASNIRPAPSAETDHHTNPPTFAPSEPSQCETETMHLNSEMDYLDYNTTSVSCVTGATIVCTQELPVETDLASCSSLGGIYYLGDISINCTGTSFGFLNVGYCTATICNSSLFTNLYNMAAESIAASYMTGSDPYYGCVGTATNVRPAARSGTLQISQQCHDEFTSLLASPFMQAAVKGRHSSCRQHANLVVCDNDSVSQQVRLACEQHSGGVFYNTQVNTTCVTYHSNPSSDSFSFLNVGICLGTSCTRSEVDNIAYYLNEQGLKQRGYDNCTSEASFDGMVTSVGTRRSLQTTFVVVFVSMTILETMLLMSLM